ncbi:MAG: hypothetical protein WC641_05805 [Patescibacteria group bacterium]
MANAKRAKLLGRLKELEGETQKIRKDLSALNKKTKTLVSDMHGAEDKSRVADIKKKLGL